MIHFERIFNKDETLIIEAEWIKKSISSIYYIFSFTCMILDVLFRMLLVYINILSPIYAIIYFIIRLFRIVSFPLLVIAIVKTIVNIIISNSELMLTNKKISGKFGNKVMDTPINKINSISLVQNFFGKRKGYYKIIISTSSGRYNFNYIKNAELFRSAILEQIDIYENEKSLRQAEQMAAAMKK